MKRIYLYGENSNFNDYDILIKDINELDCYENNRDIYLIVNDFYEFSKYNGNLKMICLKLYKVKELECGYEFDLTDTMINCSFNLMLLQQENIRDNKKKIHSVTMPDYSKKKPFRMRIIKH